MLLGEQNTAELGPALVIFCKIQLIFSLVQPILSPTSFAPYLFGVFPTEEASKSTEFDQKIQVDQKTCDIREKSLGDMR